MNMPYVGPNIGRCQMAEKLPERCVEVRIAVSLGVPLDAATMPGKAALKRSKSTVREEEEKKDGARNSRRTMENRGFRAKPPWISVAKSRAFNGFQWFSRHFLARKWDIDGFLGRYPSGRSARQASARARALKWPWNPSCPCRQDSRP